MNEGDDRKEHPAGQLPYRSGIDERRERPRMPIAAQVAMGSTLTIGGLFVLQIIVFVGSSSPLPGTAFMALIAGGVCVIAASAHKSPANRGWALGMWIGVGLIALADEICFIAAS